MLLHLSLTCNAFAISLLTLSRSAMPAKMTAFAFGFGVASATVAAWHFSDHSVAKASVFLLAMVFGGSMHFLMRARE
jgi:hypothetical protein